MGYEVYWYNNRWQGYGVPAYCDYEGCYNKIDRGLGWAYSQEDEEPPYIFCCETHDMINLEDFKFEEGKEHPEWLEWILTHDSWEEWRKQNLFTIEKYKKMLDEYNQNKLKQEKEDD